MLINSSLSDTELLILLAEDDQSAFKILYERHADQLYRSATSRLSDDALAQDMVQEVFVKLYTERKKLTQIENLKAWLSTCLRNKILNEIRNDRLHRSHHENIVQFSPVSQPAINTFDLEVLQNEFNKALLQLSDRSREVFLMSREQHLNNKAIAEELHVSVKAVEKHITTALKLLRKELISKMNIFMLLLTLLLFKNN